MSKEIFDLFIYLRPALLVDIKSDIERDEVEFYIDLPTCPAQTATGCLSYVKVNSYSFFPTVQL
jgi:hypothetical protein